MSGTWMGIIELLLVFAVVFGWGGYELYSLRKYREQDEAEKRRQKDANQQASEPAKQPKNSVDS